MADPDLNSPTPAPTAAGGDRNSVPLVVLRTLNVDVAKALLDDTTHVAIGDREIPVADVAVVLGVVADIFDVTSPQALAASKRPELAS